MSYYRVNFQYSVVVEADDEDEADRIARREMRGTVFQDVAMDFIHSDVDDLSEEDALKELGE